MAVKEFKVNMDTEMTILFLEVLASIAAIVSVIFFIINTFTSNTPDVSQLKQKVFILAFVLIAITGALFFYNKKIRVKGKIIFLLLPSISLVLIIFSLFICNIFYLIKGLGVVDNNNIDLYIVLAEEGHDKSRQELDEYFSYQAQELEKKYRLTDEMLDKQIVLLDMQALLKNDYFKTNFPNDYSDIRNIILKAQTEEIKSPQDEKNEYSSLSEAEIAFYVNQDYETAFEIYKSIVNRGTINSVPYNNLGCLYALGLGVEQDVEKARVYFSLATQRGSNVSAGNSAIIVDYEGEEVWKILEIYEEAHKQNDSRIELIIEEILILSEAEYEPNNPLEFFDWTDKEKIQIIEEAIGSIDIENIGVYGVVSYVNNWDENGSIYKKIPIYGVVGMRSTYENGKVTTENVTGVVGYTEVASPIEEYLVFSLLAYEDDSIEGNYDDVNNLLTLIDEANKKLESEDYINAYFAYKDLVDRSIENPVVYNNLGYLYSKGLGCDEDMGGAYELFLNAIDFGSVKAYGNIMLLSDSEIVTSYEQIYYMEKAYAIGDERVNIYLEEVFEINGIDNLGTDYYQEFMLLDDIKQKEYLLNCIQDYREYAGSNYNYTGQGVSSISVYKNYNAPIRDFVESVDKIV